MAKLMRAAALLVALLTMPGLAGAQTLGATNDVRATLAAFPSDMQSVRSMPVPQAAAILGGALVGGYAVGLILDGGLFTLVGALAGAVGGNAWYEKNYWPF